MPPEFTLQPLLDFRHHRVERLEIEFSQLQTAELEARFYLERLQEVQARLLAELNQHQKGELDLVRVEQLRLNQKTNENRISRQIEVLESLCARTAAKHAELVQAKQEEQSLEILKSKEIERYQALQAQNDRRLQDDIYISRAFHSRGNL